MFACTFGDQLNQTGADGGDNRNSGDTSKAGDTGATQRRTHVTSYQRGASGVASLNTAASDGIDADLPRANLDREPKTNADPGGRREIVFYVPGTDGRSNRDDVTWSSG